MSYRYAGIIKNDISGAPGFQLTFFTQGCRRACKNCYNPETWDFNGGYEFTEKTMESILKGLRANGIKRGLQIQGGEPLCPENIQLTLDIIKKVKEKLPDTKISVWTGYLKEELDSNSVAQEIFSLIDYLIDGPYIDKKRDITLYLRGSSNQRIIKMR